MKILVALSRFPFPTDKGDKLRAYYQLKSLCQKHEVYVVCLSPSKIDEQARVEVQKLCKELYVVRQPFLICFFNLFLGLFDKVPFQVHYFRSSTMKKLINRLLNEKKIDLCYIQLIRLVKNLPVNKNIVYYLDFMDSFSKGMSKRYTVSSWFEKPFVAMEAKRLKKFENLVTEKFHGFSIISDNDRQGFVSPGREKIDVIPNGVNQDFFNCNPETDRKFDIIFTGNMGYHPNIQACKYLVKEIKPLLDKKGIKVRICLAGTNPSREVVSLASEEVVVTGFVQDIRTYLSCSSMFVAPLFTGSGLQNKLLESMAAGLPTLTTRLTNQALGASDKEHIFICDNAVQFADTIENLLKNPGLAESVALKGKEFIRNSYNWDHYNSKLESALEDCVNKIRRDLCQQEEKLSLTR